MIRAAVDLSIVVPVYRSENTLRPLMQRISHVCETLGCTWEIIFVDDNSPDSSWTILEDLRTQDPRHVIAVQLMRNYGQHNAIMSGLHQVSGRLIITLDDDLQNPPEEIPRLIEAINQQHLDLIYGVAAEHKRHSRFRNLGSMVINSFARLVFKSRVTISPYRIMRHQLIANVLSYNLNFTFIDGLLMWHTQRIGSIPVAHHPRELGRSGYSLSRLISLAITLFTTFSLIPLQVASFLGISFACVGLLLGCYYVAMYFAGGILVTGYASLIVAILCLGGVQLLCLGVIGEYLGRIHLNINRKPQFVVRTILASPDCLTSDSTPGAIE
jgi:glycosyltransferase involved in cell wall biosynthesis